jgi:hypothetical protein
MAAFSFILAIWHPSAASDGTGKLALPDLPNPDVVVLTA